MKEPNYAEISKLEDLKKAAEDFWMKASSLYGPEAKVSFVCMPPDYISVTVNYSECGKTFWRVDVSKIEDAWKSNSADEMNAFYAKSDEFWEEGAQKYGADT